MNFQENLPSGRQDTGEKAHCSSNQVVQENKSSTLLRARKISALESEIQQSRQIGVM
jgi:hypothetical protein